VAARVPGIRARTRVPVGVGFGIRDAASAQAIGRVADAVVIGSRLIQEMEGVPQERAVDAAREWLAGIRRALDALPASGVREAA
jgi:tryptophan synthase alpha chain